MEIEEQDLAQDRRHGAQAAFELALLLRSLYGERSEFISEVDKRVEDLADDEVIFPHEGKVQIIQLPPDQNPLFYFDKVVENYPTSPFASEALYQKALLFQKRKQFSRALSAFQVVEERFPDSSAAKSAQKLRTHITKPEVALDEKRFMLAGQSNTFHFKYRNLAEVEFRLFRFNRKDYLADLISLEKVDSFYDISVP